MNDKNQKRKLQIKKAITLFSVIAVFVLLGYAAYMFINRFSEIRSAESFKEYILSFGAKGVLIGFLIQMLQVFVAFIPGEVIEIGLGYAYGAFLGTLICYAGLAAASTLVFLLCKKLGIKFVELFFSKEKIDSLKFVQKNIHNKDRLRKIVFVVFLIPGTPKDLITYFLGVTPLTLSEFLVISLLARIPSVISSTVGGALVHNGNYIAAAVLFVATSLLSITGWLCYDRYTKSNKR